MPTVLRIGPYRFFFYSGDRDEPPHIHVDRDDALAKFWLDPVMLERSVGFPRGELHTLQSLVQQHATEFLRAWHEYFDH